MRRRPAIASCVVLAGLLSSCGGGVGVDSARADTAATCEEVVLGIDAFNRGELDQTVAHFRTAVPIARAADDGSSEAHDLVMAVEYYAALPAEDYLAASTSSPEFARYKEITLGQCVAGVPGDGEDPEEPGQLT